MSYVGKTIVITGKIVFISYMKIFYLKIQNFRILLKIITDFKNPELQSILFSIQNFKI